MKHGSVDANEHAVTAAVGAAVESLWIAKDVASYLRVSRSWVYHRAEAGELPCLRVGALLRFEPERIKAYARGERPPMATVLAIHKR